MSDGTGNAILHLIAYLSSIAGLATIGLGIYHQEWYFGFGIVIFMTSLICHIGANLGATSESKTH